MLIVSDIWQYIPPTSCSVLGVSVVVLSSGPLGVLWVPVKAAVLWVVCFGVGYASAAWCFYLQVQT